MSALRAHIRAARAYAEAAGMVCGKAADEGQFALSVKWGLVQAYHLRAADIRAGMDREGGE